MSASVSDQRSTSPLQAPRRWAWVPLAFLLAILGLPLASHYLPREQARWTEAQAVEAQLNGQLTEATRLLESAVERAPEDRELKLRLAEFYQEAGEPRAAVELCDHLLKLNQQRSPSALFGAERFLSRLYICKLYAELQLGNGPVALDFAKRREELSPHPRQTLEGLNSLAYIRAVSGLELDQAEWCIGEILKRFQRLPDRALSRPTNLAVQTLTAGALLSRRFQKQGEFLPLVTANLLRLEELEREFQSNLLTSATSELQQLPGLQLPGEEFAIDARVYLARVRQDRAGLLLLRALLLDDLGNTSESLVDRRAAQALGCEESRWLEELESDVDALQFAETGSNLLDTEAYVRFRASSNAAQRQRALELLDVAIATDEMVLLGWRSDLPNQIQLNQDLRTWQRSVARGLAVKLRHRRELLDALQIPDQATRDAARIRELGYEREEILY
jgi:hypothetical protein